MCSTRLICTEYDATVRLFSDGFGACRSWCPTGGLGRMLEPTDEAVGTLNRAQKDAEASSYVVEDLCARS
jgi:hypothetical protein